MPTQAGGARMCIACEPCSYGLSLCRCVSPANDIHSGQVTDVLLAAGDAAVAGRVLCHTAGNNIWTSPRPSCVWQHRSTAFDQWNTHAHTPFHAAMQRRALQPGPPLVSARTHNAQRKVIDDLHARQLGNECQMAGTLHFAELNEIMCREDAHVSALSTRNVVCPPCM
jgi:hypothetical protein